MQLPNSLAARMPDIAEWRRDIHRHPELGFDTFRTSALVAEKLTAFGCDETVAGIGRTGVVGLIHGRSRASGRTIGLRADMDALPITEASGAEHASTIPGKMHACGHDGHTAMLLGAAEYLARTRDFDGSVAVIFQPAEEGEGGGRAMVEDGLIDRFGIDEVYGLHNWPGLPLGRFAFRAGPLLAASDVFTIILRGRGGHAAMPHQCLDPTLAASHLVIALQSVVARAVDPLDHAVVSVTSLRTGTDAWNVIPDTVELRGTVRTLDAAVQDAVEARVRTLAANVAAGFGIGVATEYQRSYPATVNSPEETVFAAGVARDLVGTENVETETPPTMGAEDFSFMLNERPGTFAFLGNGRSAALHHPEYDFNDDAIPYGVCYWIKLAETALRRD